MTRTCPGCGRPFVALSAHPLARCPRCHEESERARREAKKGYMRQYMRYYNKSEAKKAANRKWRKKVKSEATA